MGPGENKDNEIVSIPGLRGREPKEITLKNLSKIIHARVVEIIEQVYVEIKHLKQLVEYITGMDTRIGYPNEHLAGDSDDVITSPLFATAVGLVMDGLKRQDRKKAEAIIEEEIQEKLEANEDKP